MRILIVAAVAAPLIVGDFAQAADIKTTSRIEAVTVFPTGAEITRGAKLKLEAGEHTLLFTDLPAIAVPGSIRVEGKATGKLEIGSVDTRRVQVPRADPVVQATERRRIEAEIEKLRDERAGIEAQQKAAQSQLTLIEKLTTLPEHPAPVTGGSAAQPDWGQLFALIGTRSAEAQKALLDAQLKLRDVDRRIDDLNKKLVQLTPAQDERTEAKVFVAVGAPLDVELTDRKSVV